MDGENKGKPYEQMDDLGVFPYFWKHSNSLKFQPESSLETISKFWMFWASEQLPFIGTELQAELWVPGAIVFFAGLGCFGWLPLKIRCIFGTSFKRIFDG